jgi:hypothetical protein
MPDGRVLPLASRDTRRRCLRPHRRGGAGRGPRPHGRTRPHRPGATSRIRGTSLFRLRYPRLVRGVRRHPGTKCLPHTQHAFGCRARVISLCLPRCREYAEPNRACGGGEGSHHGRIRWRRHCRRATRKAARCPGHRARRGSKDGCDPSARRVARTVARGRSPLRTPAPSQCPRG